MNFFRCLVLAVCCCFSVSSHAYIHGYPFASFNGGAFQLNMAFLQTDGTYAFINALKSGQDWSYVNNNGAPAPDELDANGYPLPGSKALTTGGGVDTLFYIPPYSERPGNWAIDWQGGCTVGMLGASSPHTTVSGSKTSSPWIVTFADTIAANGGSTAVFLEITGNSGGCTNLRMYFVGACTAAPLTGCGDYDALQAGEMFTPRFLSVLRDAKPATIRFLDWQNLDAGFSPITQWQYNKPTNYVYYYGTERRNAGMYAGVTTNGAGCSSGGQNDYCATLGSGPPTDKQMVIVKFNASSTTSSGDPNVTFNLNGTGAVNVTDMCTCGNLGPGSTPTFFSGETPVANFLGVLIYDAQLNLWLMNFGAQTGGAGLDNNVPPQVMLQLCKEVGSHCWINIPYLSIDPDQGYVTALAQAAQVILGPHLKLYVEPPDETWNTASPFPQTNYAIRLGKYNWPSIGAGDFNQQYGKWLAIIGKDVHDVFGGDTTHYAVEGCAWTNDYANRVSDRTRWTAALFVASGGWPAYQYMTDLCIANYWDSHEYGTAQEIVDAYNYVTAGSTVTQAALASGFLSGSGLTNPPSWIDWASEVTYLNSTYGLSLGFTAYEGGYGDDFDTGNNATLANGGTASISAISTASQAVLTLGNDPKGNKMSAAAGMTVTVSAVNPSSFNGTYVVQSVGTGSSANLVTVNLDSSALTYVSSGTMAYNSARAVISSVTNAGHCVFNLATPLYIWPGTYFSVSLASPSGYNQSAASKVTAIDVTQTQITTNFNCASLGAISASGAGGPLFATAMGNAANTLREASKFTSANYSVGNAFLGYFATDGGTFPSMFYIGGYGPANGYNAWTTLDPDIYASPTPPGWQSYTNLSGGTYPYLLNRDIHHDNDNTPAFLNKAA